jgi:hypothetical protein
VRISDGPLGGVEGVFLARSGTDRVRLLLDLLGTRREVEIPSRQMADCL